MNLSSGTGNEDDSPNWFLLRETQVLTLTCMVDRNRVALNQQKNTIAPFVIKDSLLHFFKKNKISKKLMKCMHACVCDCEDFFSGFGNRPISRPLNMYCTFMLKILDESVIHFSQAVTLIN